MKLWRLAIVSIVSALLTCTMPKTTETKMYGFTVQNWKAELAGFPKEDSFAYDKKKKIACVADGVTRDFLDGSVVTRDIKGLMKVLTGRYPKYAKDASHLCVENFLETHSLEEANKSIKNYNSNRFKEIDYLAHDLAGCAAAGFWEEDGFLHWQFIADSGIAVIDSDGVLRFRTPDEGPHSKEKLPHLEKILNQHGGFNNPEGRRIIRSQYRNNPKEESAYGVLTGEETAVPYIKNEKEKLNIEDYVLAFTDGMADIIFNENKPNPKFIDVLIYNPLELEKFCRQRVYTEGTLVVYRTLLKRSFESLSPLAKRNYETFQQDHFGPNIQLHP